MAGGAARLLLRLLVAGCLVVDAIVHLHLAHGYQQAQSAGLGEGNLFRAESVVAVIAAAWVLVRGSRPAYGLAFVVGLAGCVAVLLYRYVDVPSFGPVPSMYEPVWFTQKTVSAIAEGAAAILALAGVFAGARRRDTADR